MLVTSYCATDGYKTKRPNTRINTFLSVLWVRDLVMFCWVVLVHVSFMSCHWRGQPRTSSFEYVRGPEDLLSGKLVWLTSVLWSLVGDPGSFPPACATDLLGCFHDLEAGFPRLRS